MRKRLIMEILREQFRSFLTFIKHLDVNKIYYYSSESLLKYYLIQLRYGIYIKID